MRFTAILALVLVASAIRVSQDDTNSTMPAPADGDAMTKTRSGKKGKKCKGKKPAAEEEAEVTA